MSKSKSLLVRVSREAITFVALSFGLFHAVIGVLFLDLFVDPTIPAMGIGVYLLALLSTVLLYKEVRLPWWHALYATLSAAALPMLTTPFIRERVFDSFATWYVGGAGVLLSAVIVRQRPYFAWAGALAVFTQTLVWANDAAVIGQGGLLGGMLILMAAGQAISLGVERNAAQAATFVAQATKERAESEAASARRKERRRRVSIALAKAEPILESVVSSKGKLSNELRDKAAEVELELRDIIHGRELVTKEVARAVADARARGILVALEDQGGLRALDDETRVRILKDAVAAIDSVQHGRIILRAPRKEDWALSVMVTESGESAPRLWLRLP